MSTDHPSTVDIFSIGDVTFRCWVTDDGSRYEWRSTCGRYRAGRNVGMASCWSMRDDRPVGHQYETLKRAMCAAVSKPA